MAIYNTLQNQFQDGAPPRYSVAVHEHLHTVFPHRWISQNEPLDPQI